MKLNDKLMIDKFEDAELYGEERIERMQKRIDSVNSATLKVKEMDATIRLFETLIRTEQRTIERMDSRRAAQSKHISKEDKEAALHIKQEAEKKLDLWYTFIEKVEGMKGNTESLSTDSDQLESDN